MVYYKIMQKNDFYRLSTNSEIQQDTYKLYIKIFSEGLRLQIQSTIQKVKLIEIH